MSFQSKLVLVGLFCLLTSCSKSSGGGSSGPVDPPPTPDKSCQEKQKEYVLKSDASLSLRSNPEDVVAIAFAKDPGFWEGMPRCTD